MKPLKCLNPSCLWQWFKRRPQNPKVCPRCKSPMWNKPTYWQKKEHL